MNHPSTEQPPDAEELSGQDLLAQMEDKARKMRVKFVDVTVLTLDKETGALIPRDMAERHKLVCIGKLEKTITLAMADPVDIFAIDDVQIRTGYKVEAVLALPEHIQAAWAKVYGEDTKWKDELQAMADEKVEMISDDEKSEADVVIDQPIILAVNKIITNAIDRNASDIHVEPFESNLLVRYRIDGILHEVQDFPKSIQPALISRIKIMSNLNIAERRVPQDGRIHMRTRDRDLDIRVSVLPAMQGESVVMRILDRARMRVDLGILGFSEEQLTVWRGLLDHPNGIILVTGPTGSGKSTTLYASLNEINKPEVKILTVEDPVEYYLKGLVQVQTHARVGLTFASALRSFLRQDPDIIMVGEIRDTETATIAVEAALTGHLVLSTLHTNNAPGAVTRLIDMKVEPFLIASSLIGVIAQRLVRVVCDNCKAPYPYGDELKKILEPFGYTPDRVTLYKGAGCEKCDKTGYKGRRAIYELLPVSDNFRSMVVKNATGMELTAQAKTDGLKSLYEDGLRKVAGGLTTYEELMRVTAT